MSQEGGQQKEKIKLCQLYLDVQGVPNWVLALKHSLHTLYHFKFLS